MRMTDDMNVSGRSLGTTCWFGSEPISCGIRSSLISDIGYGMNGWAVQKKEQRRIWYRVSWETSGTFLPRLTKPMKSITHDILCLFTVLWYQSKWRYRPRGKRNIGDFMMLFMTCRIDHAKASTDYVIFWLQQIAFRSTSINITLLFASVKVPTNWG